MVFFLLAMMACLQTAHAAGPKIEKLLPPKQCAQGWSIEGGIKLFDKETLFDHINGEAELYFPYGFEALAAAVYVRNGNSEEAITMDVYRMGSVLDAFGIYSNYRRPDAEPASSGAEGFVTPTQIMFYQDRFFVRIQASSAGGLDRSTLIACARSISDKIPSHPGRPREVSWLKIPHAVPHSERYLAKSLLGYDFFNSGLIADVLTGKEKIQVFVILDPSPNHARTTLAQYRAYLQKSGAKISPESERESLAAIDPLYGNALIKQSGRFLIGAVRFQNSDEAKHVIAELEKKLPKP